jgi:predicted dehydrogenase
MPTRREFLSQSTAVLGAIGTQTKQVAMGATPRESPPGKNQSFGLVGAGWRGEFYLRIARDLPETFPLVGVVVRDAGKREILRERWEARTYASVEDLIAAEKPAFVVTCIPPAANLPLLESLAQRKTPVLSETPAGLTLPDLHRIATLAANGARIQIAEQYLFQPMHTARMKLVLDGKLGTVHEADVSCAHGFHGISLLRHYLQTDFALPKISAQSFKSPAMVGPDRSGPPQERMIVPAERVIAQLDWGDRLGILDFTSDQYFSWIRRSRLLIRGEEGEIKDDHVRFLKDFRTPIDFTLLRQDTGHDGSLEGYYHRSISGNGELLYENAFSPARWSDDEIAVATALAKMQRYIGTGESFYSVPEACHDRYLDLLIAQAVQSGGRVNAVPQPWMPRSGSR